ncbi:unnamed protein product [Phyllotreta striolata]|uniref:Uncharacterized protein n=1 Tax=Phyllotreta striolata TaxID=444603 RepID=A0A9N9XKT3_PHYSR|nr:unnamed protein product [Phyllotreta striolata]
MRLFLLLWAIFEINGNFAWENELDVLSENLIENLRVDPFLNGESTSGKLSQTSKQFIDKHVEQYKQLVLTSQRKKFSRSKRSLREIEAEWSDYVTEIAAYGNITGFRAKDVRFFRQNSQWYSATLVPEQEVLRISRYQDLRLHTVLEVSITNGTRLATFPLENSTLLVVAENSTSSNFTTIYKFNAAETLEIIQRVEGTGYYDVNIWEDNGNVFMSLIGSSTNSTILSPISRIYKWRSGHFDVLQNVSATGVSRTTAFRIRDAGFLAIARNRPEEGDERVYADIWKFDVESETYELFQRILTYGCEDIKYFQTGSKGEGFLVVANFLRKDSRGEIYYNAPSIIYKVLDNYFVPFQTLSLTGVYQFDVIHDENGDALLIALTLEGLKSFIYDGWRFVESRIKFDGTFDKNGIKALKAYRINNRNLIAVMRENFTANEGFLYEVNFTSKRKYEKLYDELLNWCQATTVEINEKYSNTFKRVRRNEESEYTGKFADYASKLSNIEKTLRNSPQFPGDHVFGDQLEAKSILLNDSGKFASLSTDKINGRTIDSILENSLNVNGGFGVDSTSIKIDFLRTDELQLRAINNRSIRSLIRKGEINDLNAVKILDSAVFEGDVTVENQNIPTDHVPLNIPNQKLRMSEVEADEITDVGDEKKQLKNVSVLKTKNLIVGGYLNDVDVATLEKYALRKSGRQDITAESYYFDRVETEFLDTDRLSDSQIPNDLVLTKTGNFTVPKSLLFTEPLAINNLLVSKQLDNIKISREGTLDLLLKNTTTAQHVTSTKTFVNLHVINPIDLRGKPIGKDFERMDPLKRIEKDITVDKNVEITGDTVVETLLKSTDITASGTIEHSFNRLIQNGLKLNNKNINLPVVFLDHLNVDELTANVINGVNPENLVVTGAKHTQVIRGWKTFNGDLEITGDTDVTRINNINTVEFEKNVLKTEGEQVITGTHEIDNVIALGRLKINNVKFGEQPWKSVLTTTGNQTIHPVLVASDLKANRSSVKRLAIDGEINGVDFARMMRDTISKDEFAKVSGVKNFTDLVVENLTIAGDFGLARRLEEMENLNLTLENLDRTEGVVARNVYFGSRLNGVDLSEFEIDEENAMDDKIVVEGDHEFEEITVLGDVYIESNEINDIDLDDIQENSVKTDEQQIFVNAQFGEIFVPTSITLDGQIENVDLDEIFQNNKTDPQNILDKLRFKKGLTVTETLTVKDHLNGMSISELCALTNSTPQKNIIIEGDVHFVRGPHVEQFNNLNVKEFNDNLWFTDRPIALRSNFEFDSNATVRDKVHLRGLLNDCKVQYLSENYLSKTKDQSVEAELNFLDGAVFLRDVATTNLEARFVNEINVKEFPKTILMHRQQLFEDIVYFDEVTAEDLKGDYQVNKLNLDADVMRYDKKNLITGSKSLRELDVDLLSSKRPDASVQEVAIDRWLDRAVLNEGAYKITGTKTFRNVFVRNGTNLMGSLKNIAKVNNESVLIKNVPQDITGRKTFVENALNIKSMKIKGLFNGDDLMKVLNNQANKREDTYLNSPLEFTNVIDSNNVHFNAKYNGIDVVKLLKNISAIGTLEHIEEKYEDLLEMIGDVETSLSKRAFYLDYFKPVIDTNPVTQIFAINGQIVSFENDSNSNVMALLNWHERLELFKPYYEKELGPYPTYAKKLEDIDGAEVIYIEHPKTSDDNGDYTHVGQFMSLDNTTKRFFAEFQTKGTRYATSFLVKDSNCLLFVDYGFTIEVLCSGPNKKFSLRQTIKNEHPIMASVITVDEVPHLITIQKDDHPKTLIWKLDRNNQFQIFDSYSEGDPIDLTTVTTEKGSFVAVAYKYLPNTKDFGKIIIRRYEKSSGKFVKFQSLKLKEPAGILFSELPSKEIALYATTRTASEHFLLFLYQGVSGFVRKIGSSTVRNIEHIEDITLDNQHFLFAHHKNGKTVLQAVFKGNKIW